MEEDKLVPITTGDGRHRIAVYNAMGIPWIRASVTAHQREILKKRGISIKEAYPVSANKSDEDVMSHGNSQVEKNENSDKQSDRETDRNANKYEIKSVKELIEFTNKMLEIENNDVTPEMIEKVNSYFKYGCTEKIGDYQMYVELQNFALKLKDKNKLLNTKIDELEILEQFEKMKKIDEKINLIQNYYYRLKYDLENYHGKMITRQLNNEVSNNAEEFTKQSDLKDQIIKLAEMEVDEELTPEIVATFYKYIQNGSIDEKMNNWETVDENFKSIKYYLMKTASKYLNQFLYYDHNREDLKKTVSSYKRLREKIELIEKVREKLNSEIQICYKRLPGKSDVFGKLKNKVEKIRLTKTDADMSRLDEKYFHDFIDRGFRNESQANEYYEYFGIMDGDLNVKWEEKIKILNDIEKELDKINENGKNKNVIDLRNKLRNRIEKELSFCKEYKNQVELYNACSEIGLKRDFTPGQNNNCALESITRTINISNDNTKDDASKAYEEAAKWQETLRHMSDQIGIPHTSGFILNYKILHEMYQNEEISSTYYAHYSEFLKLLKDNLDNKILTVWSYDPETGHLIKFGIIKGVNSKENGQRINILKKAGHVEPMFSIKDAKQERVHAQNKLSYKQDSKIQKEKGYNADRKIEMGMSEYAHTHNEKIDDLENWINILEGAWESVDMDYIKATDKLESYTDNGILNEDIYNTDTKTIKQITDRYKRLQPTLSYAIERCEEKKAFYSNVTLDNSKLKQEFEQNTYRKFSDNMEKNDELNDELQTFADERYEKEEEKLDLFELVEIKINREIAICNTANSEKIKNSETEKETGSTENEENATNTLHGGDEGLAYSDPSRVVKIKHASEKAGFIRGYASGSGNNCFIQSLLQGIHKANGTKENNPQKALEEASVWEKILRDEAVVNGFEKIGYLGVSYGKADQLPGRSSLYDLHKSIWYT